MNYRVLLILRRYFNRFQIFKFFIVLLLIMLLVNLYVIKPHYRTSQREMYRTLAQYLLITPRTRAVFAYRPIR